jgi:hypothetical protein
VCGFDGRARRSSKLEIKGAKEGIPEGPLVTEIAAVTMYFSRARCKRCLLNMT